MNNRFLIYLSVLTVLACACDGSSVVNDNCKEDDYYFNGADLYQCKRCPGEYAKNGLEVTQWQKLTWENETEIKHICLFDQKTLVSVTEKNGIQDSQICDDKCRYMNGKAECGETCEIEDALKCDGDNKNILKCKDGWFQHFTPCEFGCSDGVCLDKECEDGMTRCGTDNDIQVCENNSWIKKFGCEYRCQDGKCVDKTCTDGETQCDLNGKIQLLCLNNQWKMSICSGKCIDGKCVELLCKEDEKRCNNNIVERCADEAWIAENVCADGYFCISAECLKCENKESCLFIKADEKVYEIYYGKSGSFNVHLMKGEESLTNEDLIVSSSDESCVKAETSELKTDPAGAVVRYTTMNPEGCTADLNIADKNNANTFVTVQIIVKPVVDENNNYMGDDEEVEIDDVTCRNNADCALSETDPKIFCDSYIGYKCSTKCTSDTQCISDDYFCRGDGRCVPKVFETVWETLTNNEELIFPMDSADVCNFVIDWGDGVTENVDKCDGKDLSHTYASKGEHHVKISGYLYNWSMMSSQPDSNSSAMESLIKRNSRLLRVISFGPVVLGESAFAYAMNLTSVSSFDIPQLSIANSARNMFLSAVKFNSELSNWDVSKVTDMSSMFNGAAVFNQDISDWDVSQVTNMSSMFNGAAVFNQDISDWDVSQVTNMSSMFNGATVFNQDISKWKVSQVTNMSSMFNGALVFNQDISKWNVSNVTNMSSIFNGAVIFNQDISKWNVSNVTDMSSMFNGALTFDREISGWDVSNVTNMNSMFKDAAAFNQDISKWNVSNVTNMSSMFSGAAAFNQSLNGWDVSNVTNMNSMFKDAAAFNQDISKWNLSNVTNMSSMFSGAAAFNQNISSWDVSNVTNMSSMFNGAKNFNSSIFKLLEQSKVTNMRSMFKGAAAFNQNISGWDVSNVTNMSSMFSGAAAFNQSLNGWDVSKVTNMRSMFEGAEKFTQNISAWNVSNVTDMSSMFEGAKRFNSSIFKLLEKKSQVTNMSSMFKGAVLFNRDISGWDVSNVTNMSSMFKGAAAFNKSLSGWNVSNVTDMSSMFEGAEAFNNYNNTLNWNNKTSNVTNMSSMFEGAAAFNRDISGWDVSNVKNVSAMFKNAKNFNQNLMKWNLQSSKITDETKIKDIFSGTSMDKAYFCENWNDLTGTVWEKYFDVLGLMFTCP